LRLRASERAGGRVRSIDSIRFDSIRFARPVGDAAVG
jgi:hypothetical protein